MRLPLDRGGVLEVFYSQADRSSLDEILSTPEGALALESIVDSIVEADAQGTDDGAQLRLSHASHEVAPPASGAQKSTVMLELSRSRPDNMPRTLPAGTRVKTADGHVFLTDGPLTFGAAEVNVWKAVGGTALVPGPMGIIPPGELTAFDPVARGVTGIGLNVTLFPGAGQPKHLYIQTDLAKPHPFAQKHVGLYVRIESVENIAFLPNVGRSFQIARVNAANPWGSATTPEGAFARSVEADTTVDSQFSGWLTGAHAFEWRVLDWGEDLGFRVRNTTTATRGRVALLDERASTRGRPRQTGEPDESLRPRLLRKPQKPSPLGLLRKVVLAASAYGFNRSDVRIYEMGKPGPGPIAIDPYGPNFPASMGFIADLHCADMTTPDTPDGMASASPTYTALSPFFNPGLALTDGGTGAPCFPRWCVFVRVDTPLTGATLAAFRKAVFEAAKNAVQPGCAVFLYHPPQQGFP